MQTANIDLPVPVKTFTFAAAWGYLMHKTDGWIGPGLMHAASDSYLFIEILSK